MRDRVGRASLHAVAAEDTPVVVDVVDLGVALGRADARLLGVVRRLYIDAVGRTRRRAQKAGHTLLQPSLVALQLVLAAESLLKLRSAHRPLAVGIVLHLGRLKDLPQSDAHSLGNRSGIFHDGHSKEYTTAAQPGPPRLRGLVENPEQWPWSSFQHCATCKIGTMKIESE